MVTFLRCRAARQLRPDDKPVVAVRQAVVVAHAPRAYAHPIRVQAFELAPILHALGRREVHRRIADLHALGSGLQTGTLPEDQRPAVSRGFEQVYCRSHGGVQPAVGIDHCQPTARREPKPSIATPADPSRYGITRCALRAAQAVFHSVVQRLENFYFVVREPVQLQIGRAHV